MRMLREFKLKIDNWMMTALAITLIFGATFLSKYLDLTEDDEDYGDDFFH